MSILQKSGEDTPREPRPPRRGSPSAPADKHVEVTNPEREAANKAEAALEAEQKLSMEDTQNLGTPEDILLKGHQAFLEEKASTARKAANLKADADAREKERKDAEKATADVRAKHPWPKKIPHQGFRGWFWRLLGKHLYHWFGWQWLAKQSWGEREFNAIERVWAQRANQKFIAFINRKGGSCKTAICTWFAALHAWAINIAPLVLDVNDNQGGTAGRLGIKRSQTLDFDKYVDEVAAGRLQTRAELEAEIPTPHRQTGTLVIASTVRTDNSRVDSDEDIDAAYIRSKTYGRDVYADCGNAIEKPYAFYAVRHADTVVRTVNVNTQDSPEFAEGTAQFYRNQGCKAKIDKGFVTVVGVKAKERGYWAEFYGMPEEQIIAIPYNEYMANLDTRRRTRGSSVKVDPDDTKRPVDLTKLPRHLRVIMLEALADIMEAESAPLDDVPEQIDNEAKEVTATTEEVEPADDTAQTDDLSQYTVVDAIDGELMQLVKTSNGSRESNDVPPYAPALSGATSVATRHGAHAQEGGSQRTVNRNHRPTPTGKDLP